jgi:hypothetical protein
MCGEPSRRTTPGPESLDDHGPTDPVTTGPATPYVNVDAAGPDGVISVPPYRHRTELRLNPPGGHDGPASGRP